MKESTTAALRLFDNIEDAVVTIDVHNSITSWNRAAEALYGLAAEDAIGRPLSAVLLVEGCSGGGLDPTEGSCHAVHIVGPSKVSVRYSLRSFEGSGAARILVASDNTQCKREREELTRCAEIAASSELAANMGSWSWDPHSNAVEWSDNQCRLHGISPEDFEGSFEHALKFVHPADLADVMEGCELLLAHKEALPFGYRIITADGITKDVRGANRLIFDDDGEIKLIVGVVLDVSEQKLAEEARQASDLRYASILDHSPDAVVGVDENQCICVFNQSAEALFGYSGSEILGESLDVLIPTGKANEHRRQMEDFSHDANHKHMSARKEICGVKKDGTEFAASASISSQVVAGERLMTAFVRDLTAEKELERRYLQSQKMEAVGRLAGGIAHDFNNMLSGILCFATLVKDGVEGNKEAVEDIESVLECCDRASVLTGQLLTFSRSDIAEVSRFDVNTTLGELLRLLERMIGEDIELKISLGREPAEILLGAGHLEQILMNLAVNARDAMPRGGRLRVSVQVIEIEPEIHNVDVKPGSYVQLVVSDTGCGMDETTQERIFEPFFTSKPQGKGTGLGLSTVYGIVTQAGGGIEVESKEGEGTTFTVLLPHCVRKKVSNSLPPVLTKSPTGSENVMVVEDDQTIRHLVRRVLTANGYTVTTAADGQRALEILEQKQSSPGLLLTDIVMPQMSGLELAGKVRAEHPDAKILFMSGYTDEIVAAHGFLQSGASLLRKPFTPDSLFQAVRHMLDVQ